MMTLPVQPSTTGVNDTVVKIFFVIRNLNYDLVVSNQSLTTTLVISLKEEVSLAVGSVVGTDSINLDLSPGSVFVNATIFPPPGMGASELLRLYVSSSDSMATSILVMVARLFANSEAATGSIAVEIFETFLALAVQTTATVSKQAPTTTTTGTTAVSGPVIVPEPTPMVVPVVVSSTSFVAFILCFLWCWRKSRHVTEGNHEINGVKMDYQIKRPRTTIYGRTTPLPNREKTVITWEYDQEEVIRCHASFDTGARSGDVILDIDDSSGPAEVAAWMSDEEEPSNAVPSDWRTSSYKGSLPETFHTAYPDGTAVEYFSQTHGQWVAGVISRTRLGERGMDLVFDVQIGKRTRTQVNMVNLRPRLTEDMPVFACTQPEKKQDDEWAADSEDHLRLFASPRKDVPRGDVWQPARIHGRQSQHATRTGYRVRMEEDANVKNASRIFCIPAHRLRRRFPPGSRVDVWRGPTLGWQPEEVHSTAEQMVLAQRGVPKGHRSKRHAGASEERSPGERSNWRYDTIDTSPSSFYTGVVPPEGLRKDSEEEGQLVPICDSEGDPDWVPGFLLRHSEEIEEWDDVSVHEI